MSDKTTDAPRVPSGWQIERAVAIWQAAHNKFLGDPELELDEETILSVLASAQVDDPRDLLSRLIDAVIWCQRREAEADDLRRDMTARRDRYAMRAERLRETVHSLMNVLQVDKHRATLASASIGRGRVHVVITDDAKLTDEYVEITRTPRKSLIREHIDAGVIIEGAELSNPQPTLVIRKL